jgi:hypothetical protein
VTLVETYSSGKVKVTERRGAAVWPGAVLASYLPRCCHYLGKAWRLSVKKTNKSGQSYAKEGGHECSE